MNQNWLPMTVCLLVAIALACLAGTLLWGKPQAPESDSAGEPEGDGAVSSFVKDGTLDLDAVVKHFEDMYRSDSSISTAELVVTKPRRTRTLRMKVWTQGDEKALIVVQAPLERKARHHSKWKRTCGTTFPVSSEPSASRRP